MYPVSLFRVGPPLSPSHFFHFRTPFLLLLLPPPPLTFPFSQHSWAVPHQSKAQFMRLMLWREQTAFWDRMFGRFLALLKQTSPPKYDYRGERGSGARLASVHPGHANARYISLLTHFHMQKRQDLKELTFDSFSDWQKLTWNHLKSMKLFFYMKWTKFLAKVPTELLGNTIHDSWIPSDFVWVTEARGGLSF